MKSTILAALTCITIGALPAQAGMVCGPLTKSNICHTLQGCSHFFLHDQARGEEGNPYTVEAKTETAQSDLEEYANTDQPVCVSGHIGTNGDPDLIQATVVIARKSDRLAENMIAVESDENQAIGPAQINSELSGPCLHPKPCGACYTSCK